MSLMMNCTRRLRSLPAGVTLGEIGIFAVAQSDEPPRFDAVREEPGRGPSWHADRASTLL